MAVTVLVAALEQDVAALIKQMQIRTDAVIVNQCNHDGEEVLSQNGREIRVQSMNDRGVGKSRNAAIRQALTMPGEILLFSDQDIVYEDGYEAAMDAEFAAHPEADMILFNIKVAEERATYHTKAWKRVKWYNCGRYGAVSFAIRKEMLKECGVQFSLLYGGGAKYSAGEDSLFLKALMDQGVRVYASPVLIGTESAGESTWFRGYGEKFFFDRGALYQDLYGMMAKPWALRFLLAHRDKLCTEMTWQQAYRVMKRGMKERRTSIEA
ncbi:MAG: glycosyltransferase family 2 protein [Lachnospiraceae bacterium]|nr:glycosyltransferase family 2 protein [Lachnospiraceae bacterium]